MTVTNTFKIKQAYWKSQDGFLDNKYDITAYVIEQNGIYFDPSDDDFLDAVFKEYVRHFCNQESITLTLCKEDLYFYGENVNVYLLNHIYQELLGGDEKPFDPILRSKEEGSINLSLFNGFDKQIYYLIAVLDKMEIDFKALREEYMVLEFPDSLESHEKAIITDLRYEGVKPNLKG
jgi:hypothetical protein